MLDGSTCLILYVIARAVFFRPKQSPRDLRKFLSHGLHRFSLIIFKNLCEFVKSVKSVAESFFNRPLAKVSYDEVQSYKWQRST
jgi:hypothetical protein